MRTPRKCSHAGIRQNGYREGIRNVNVRNLLLAALVLLGMRLLARREVDAALSEFADGFSEELEGSPL